MRTPMNPECEFFLAKGIKDGLAQGKTPTEIGKILSPKIEQKFNVSISAESIRSRARSVLYPRVRSHPAAPKTYGPTAYGYCTTCKGNFLEPGKAEEKEALVETRTRKTTGCLGVRPPGRGGIKYTAPGCPEGDWVHSCRESGEKPRQVGSRLAPYRVRAISSLYRAKRGNSFKEARYGLDSFAR